eukprot:TRINITY_DN6093_c0_g1_i1.p1 TRINITY_DN6093_c0_g1~~TRINITY_DN6093_c0_g1_i1.p1  ORF type:complete len:261 (-),score=50.34 TRINITY_DN6093_c0_g1_i1:79-801(-)
MSARRLYSLIPLRTPLSLSTKTPLPSFSSPTLSKGFSTYGSLTTQQTRLFSTSKEEKPPTVVESILKHNKEFVERKDYTAYKVDRYPQKKVVVLTCMDTRLSELLPRAMDLKQGDAKILKTAGAVVNYEFGSIMRSIIVAVYNLQAEDIIVVGHEDCGMAHLNSEEVLEKAKKRGVRPETINILKNSGVNLDHWLHNFESVEEAVTSSVEKIKNHPLLPKDINVYGMVMCPVTGKLTPLV